MTARARARALRGQPPAQVELWPVMRWRPLIADLWEERIAFIRARLRWLVPHARYIWTRCRARLLAAEADEQRKDFDKVGAHPPAPMGLRLGEIAQTAQGGG